MANDTAANQGVVGDTIFGFEVAVKGFSVTNDLIQFVNSQFDPLNDIGNGALTDGLNFETLGADYDGTNANSTNFAAGSPSFVLDSTDTLYYDPDGAAAGYRVVADFQGGTSPEAGNIEIVDAIGGVPS